MSEYKGLIAAGTLLASFAILALAIPVELYVSSTGRLIEPPDYFELGDLFYYSETALHYLNDTGGGLWALDNTYRAKDVDIGEWNIDLLYKRPNASGTYNIVLYHFHTEWIIFPASHNMEWFNENGASRGTNLLVNELHSDLDGDSQINYYAECDHTRYYLQIAFNSTIYANVTDAWDHGGVGVFFGVRFDDTNTGYNAMNLIASILFFQMPDVHWSINSLIAVPIWIAVGYISIILILRAIDALPFT